MDLFWHLTVASDGRHPLFSCSSERLAGVRALGRVAGERTLLLAVVDDHVHMVVRCAAGRAGLLGRTVRMALRPLVSAPAEPARVRRVEDRSHLRWLVRYVLAQVEHHGLAGHPATDPGSCFQDLVGARRVPGLRVAELLAAALPRFRLRHAYAAVGLPTSPLEPAETSAVRRRGAQGLAEASAAALGMPWPLRGKTGLATRARAATCQLGCAAGISVAELAFALDIGRSAVSRLSRCAAEPQDHMATRLQLALRGAVGRAQARGGHGCGGDTPHPHPAPRTPHPAPRTPHPAPRTRTPHPPPCAAPAIDARSARWSVPSAAGCSRRTASA